MNKLVGVSRTLGLPTDKRPSIVHIVHEVRKTLPVSQWLVRQLSRNGK